MAEGFISVLRGLLQRVLSLCGRLAPHVARPQHHLATETPRLAAQSAAHRVRVLCVGINYTAQARAWHLRGCRADAERMAAHFARLGAEDTLVYTDEPVAAGDRRRAGTGVRMQQIFFTGSTLRAHLKNFLGLGAQGTLSPESLQRGIRVATFACHGEQRSDISGEETDGLDECLALGHDNEHVTDDDINALVMASLAQYPERRLLLLFDCCHSGSIADLRFAYDPAECAWFDAEGTRYEPDESANTRGLALAMGGCTSDGLSYEVQLSDNSVAGAFGLAFRRHFGALSTPVLAAFHAIREEVASHPDFKQEVQLASSQPFGVTFALAADGGSLDHRPCDK